MASRRWSFAGLAVGSCAALGAIVALLSLLGALSLWTISRPLTALKPDTTPGIVNATFDPAGWSHASRGAFVLTEDGRPLGPRSDMIDDTRKSAGGAYSVWRGTVWFSASDGSDARLNGRVYALRGPFIPDPLALPVLTLLALSSFVFAAPGHSAAEKVRNFTGAAGFAARRSLGVLRKPLPLFAAVQVVLLATTPWRPLTHWTGGQADIWQAGGVAAFLLIAFWLRAANLPRGIRLFYRVGLGLFVAAAAARHAEWVEAALLPPVPNVVWILVLAAAAWFRPAFMVPAVLVYAWEHDAIVRAMQGLLIDAYVDWLPILELYLYFLFSVVGVSLVTAMVERAKPRADAFAVRAAFLLAGAIHFANYFHSGVEKLRLDGGVTSWLLDNETFRLASNGIAIGVSPIGSFPGLAQAIVEGWQSLNLLGNIVTLGTQLLSLAAAGFPVAAGLLCVVFDAWHVGVAAFTGIFFWKWIALNVTLAYAYNALRGPVVWPLRLAAAAMVVAAPGFFSIAKLGWYDTPAVNAVRVFAETRDGRAVPVPSDFFRAHSFQFVASAIWSERMQREFMPTDTWGTTKSIAAKRLADACVAGEPRADDPAGLLKPQTAALVALRHAQALAAPTDLRLPSDRIYPHHVFADPFGFADFDALDLRTVVRYRIDVEALCLIDVSRPPDVVRRVTALVVPVGER